MPAYKELSRLLKKTVLLTAENQPDLIYVAVEEGNVNIFAD